MIKPIARTIIATTLIFGVVSNANAWPTFIRGHKICALNVNRARHALGLPQSHSAAAISFRKFKGVSHPKKGNVMIVRRKDGGYHVALVLGNGMCLNPSLKAQSWQEKPCRDIWKGQPRHFVS